MIQFTKVYFKSLCLNLNHLSNQKKRSHSSADKMAHITSNCLYLDQQEGGQHQSRTYGEVIEVDRETRRKDCKICIYSMGLICSLVIIAMMFFNIIKFTDIKNNLFSSFVRYICYFILFVVTILFIYAIAKVREMSCFRVVRFVRLLLGCYRVVSDEIGCLG